MSFLIRNKTIAAINIDDLGLQVPAGGGSPNSFDLVCEDPRNVAKSDDLIARIQAGDICVLDPLDGATELSPTISEEIVRVHNDPHYRIRGGDLDQLDDVDTTGADGGCLLQCTLTGSPLSPIWTAADPSVVGNNISLFDLGDVNAPTTLGSPFNLGTNSFIFVGDGSGNLIVTPITGAGSPSTGGPLCEPVEDIVAAMLARSTHTDVTVTYIDGAGSCDGILNFSIDDVFLHNSGTETFGPGTLTIDGGATLIISGPTGSPGTPGGITILQDAIATIATPSSNFTDPDQIVNKEYVDSVAAGFDPKESVRACTTVPLDATPASGSPKGVGTTLTLTGAPVSLTLDGVSLVNGDRVLVKNGLIGSPNGFEWNGIYVVSGVGTGIVLTRALDQDGHPNAEVSGGNFVFVEEGTTCANTGWVISSPNGVADVDNEDIVWTQFSGAGSILGDVGLAQTGTTLALDLSTGELTTATIALEDRIAFHDDNGAAQAPTGTQTYGTTIQDFVDDLGIVYNITGTGIIAAPGGSPGPYNTVTIVAAGPGDRDGIEVINGDASGGNPVIGLDIENLPAGSGSPMDTTDRVAVYDISTDTNVYYTVGQIATSLASVNSFETWANSGGTGSVNIVADSPTDTVTLVSSTGINIDFTAGTDTLTFTVDASEIELGDLGDVNVSGSPALSDGDVIVWRGSPGQWVNEPASSLSTSFDICTLTSGSLLNLDINDTVAVCDGANTVSYSIEDILNNFNIPSGVTGSGIVVKTSGSPIAYATRSIVASTNEDLLGANVVNGDGSVGNIEVGVTIDTLADPNADLDATDEFIVHDKSEGTGGANRKMTGQNVADGVANILGLVDLSVQQIGGSGSPGQFTLFLTDNERGKDLSISEFILTWSEASVSNNDWLEIGNATDADISFIVPMNATIVRATGISVSAGSSKGIDLYLDTVATATPLITIPSGINAEVSDVTLNINVAAGQRVRLRGASTGGTIQDTTVALWLKWRA